VVPQDLLNIADPAVTIDDGMRGRFRYNGDLNLPAG
jgi:hypothetical protein